MTKEEFLEELASTLSENHLDENRELGSVELFDSTGLMSVLVMVDRLLGIRLNVDAMRDCKTVGDLVKLVADKLV